MRAGAGVLDGEGDVARRDGLPARLEPKVDRIHEATALFGDLITDWCAPGA